MKKQLAAAIFNMIESSIQDGTLGIDGDSGDVTGTTKISDLQLMVWVRPAAGTPRRAFIVQVKEQM